MALEALGELKAASLAPHGSATSRGSRTRCRPALCGVRCVRKLDAASLAGTAVRLAGLEDSEAGVRSAALFTLGKLDAASGFAWRHDVARLWSRWARAQGGVDALRKLDATSLAARRSSRARAL